MSTGTESREQSEAIWRLCAEHGGALCQASEPAKGTSSIVLTVYAEGVGLDADGVLSPLAPVQARYRILASGEVIDISPGKLGLRPEGGQL